jgi:hypothetical protein
VEVIQMNDARPVSPFTGLRLPFDKAAPASLKKAGVSSFQQMWEQVYSKTEQVNRESAVGGTSVSGARASSQSLKGHAAEASLSMDFAEPEAPAQRVGLGDSEPYQGVETGRTADQTVSISLPEFAVIAVPVGAEGVPAIGVSKGFFTGERSPLLSNTPASILWEATLPDTLPAVHPAALQTADNAVVFRDILDQIRSLNPQDGQTVVLQLNPGDLGGMQIEVSVEHQRVRADILTSDPMAKEWLEGNQGILHQALARQGFGVERFSVSVGDPEHDFARAEKREAVVFLADPLLPYGTKRMVLPSGQWPDGGRTVI